MAVYTVHGGHAAHGKKNCGAVGYCSESLVDRQIKDAVIKHLRLMGHTVYDCTVDSGLTAGTIITAIKKKINSHAGVTANISIHLNASTKSKADNKTKGTECLVYSLSDKTACDISTRICANMKKLGFTNRGIKERTNLAVLKGIKNGGTNILVESLFCDDEDDYKLLNSVGTDRIGKAIAEGIVGQAVVNKTSFKYNGVDYSKVFDPEFYAKSNPDVAQAFGDDAVKLFNHFRTYGIKEISRAGKTIATFNVAVYKAHSADLRAAFGDNLPEYYKHYCQYGYKENRRAI